MKKEILISFAGLAAGIVLILLAVFVFTGSTTLNGACYGVGAALIALSGGNLIGKSVVKSVETPEIRKIQEIEMNDERNIRIRERAGWNTVRIFTPVLCFLTLATALIGVELYVTLAACGLVVLLAALSIGSQIYYDKRL
ncbi:hypothetical protein Mlab_0036 [Methanocorpusculum labreanum Z]|uniref:DUF2178 domain-containing protein n=1 Tax=Methanocorpusculum labreanum (strain ATCC 43576 / DSM 4855 / Z) TaxID=410358 RepID=A2SPF8_METLZ|nr:hypothetical protein [Methanocorpusculum labreanum]ABN06214.1 hypothetical protein Mlab_0036 [Methanocorpusculum labreanum Z]